MKAKTPKKKSEVRREWSFYCYVFYTIKVCFISREPFFLLKEKNNKEKNVELGFFFFSWNEKAHT